MLNMCICLIKAHENSHSEESLFIKWFSNVICISETFCLYINLLPCCRTGSPPNTLLGKQTVSLKHRSNNILGKRPLILENLKSCWFICLHPSRAETSESQGRACISFLLGHSAGISQCLIHNRSSMQLDMHLISVGHDTDLSPGVSLCTGVWYVSGILASAAPWNDSKMDLFYFREQDWHGQREGGH